MNSRFCTNCGAPNPDDTRFCTICGADLRLGEDAAPVTPAPFVDPGTMLLEQFKATASAQPAASVQQPAAAAPVAPAGAPQGQEKPITARTTVDGGAAAAAPAAPAPAPAPIPIAPASASAPSGAPASAPASAPAAAPAEEAVDYPTTILYSTKEDKDGEGAASTLPAAVLIRTKNGERHPINKTPFVIGKNRRADFIIEANSAVSNKHLKLSFQGGDFYATDLGSTNGSFVNSNRIQPKQPYLLHFGDHLYLANEEFLFTRG